jgi:hypothetical protein
VDRTGNEDLNPKTSKNPSEMLDLLKTLPLECDI